VGGVVADPVEIKIGSTASDTVDVLGLDDIKADLKLELPQPLKTDSVSALTINPVKAELDTTTHLEVDPLKTDSSLSVDLKPAVVDLCVTLNVGKLPNACIKQPYHHHIGFTLWGTEIWGYTFSGEQETVIQEHHPQPKVALGGTAAAWSPPRLDREPPSRETGGLRIRLGA
jgi:hypothetical protein